MLSINISTRLLAFNNVDWYAERLMIKWKHFATPQVVFCPCVGRTLTIKKTKPLTTCCTRVNLACASMWYKLPTLHRIRGQAFSWPSAWFLSLLSDILVRTGNMRCWKWDEVLNKPDIIIEIGAIKHALVMTVIQIISNERLSKSGLNRMSVNVDEIKTKIKQVLKQGIKKYPKPMLNSWFRRYTPL